MTTATAQAFANIAFIKYWGIFPLSVRAKLDDAAFTKAWAAGGAMTLDQALTEALGGGG